MYGEIVFYTHGSTIEYGGEIFPAGELTADILNFAPEDYRPIQRLLDRMKELSKQYEDTLDRGVWWELNNQLIELRSQLMRYRVFQILLREDDQFLNETQQYTESYSLQFLRLRHVLLEWQYSFVFGILDDSNSRRVLPKHPHSYILQ